MLVAVSIPIFTAKLEKSREVTDLANVRAAYAEQMTTLFEWDGTDANLPADITVPAKQTQDNWQSAGDDPTTTIAEGHQDAGISVSASTTSYVVSVTDDGTGIEVTAGT